MILLAGSCWGDEAAIREAIAKAIPPIETGSIGSANERRCFTCHNQGLPILTFLKARDLGFEIDEKNLERQTKHTYDHLARGKASYKKGTGQGGKADTAGMALWALYEAGREPDEVTSAVVDFLLKWNEDIPHWRPQSDRPPSEGSFFTSTFLALLGLDAYGTDAHADPIKKRTEAARIWLLETEPEETEDAVFRLFALDLLKDAAAAEKAARQLLELQAEDGGWAQQPEMQTEAYSTGSALVALVDSGQLRTEDPAFRRGIEFLLRTQLEDGTWKVVSRSRPIQTPYESGFPHGDDQFISSAGSCWAVLALAEALK